MVNPKISSVELIPAFSWTCPECGRDHFERSIVAEFSEEEMQELRDEHGVQPWEAGEFCTQPASVRCPDCNLSFQTLGYGEE